VVALTTAHRQVLMDTVQPTEVAENAVVIQFFLLVMSGVALAEPAGPNFTPDEPPRKTSRQRSDWWAERP
jgi:hypothetical protein